MCVLKMTELALSGKRVLIRQDLNVPLRGGVVANDKRIRASLPTLEYALGSGAAVMVMSHLGRPIEGEFREEFSLRPVAAHLAKLLGRPVRLERDWLGGVQVAAGEVVLCENVRFSEGEKGDSEALGRKMAALCDVYVMDAFGTAHRAQASTHAVARFAPVACAGPLLAAELEALGTALGNPARPMLAIVGGSKVSTKITILDALARKVDQLIPGGGIANNFIKASGHGVGKSLYEPDQVEQTRRLMATAAAAGGFIPAPVDVYCALELSEAAPAVLKDADKVGPEDMVLDVGPRTSALYAEMVGKARTIVWNGPVGVFEYEQFSRGTEALARAVAESDAFSIAGGGDTVAALEQFGLADRVSYVSTGGGAFLEFLEGKTLPAVAVLEERARKN